MDPFWDTLAAIKAAQLRAPTYRVARELLDLASDSGQLKISRDALRELCCTTSDDTARGYLWQLKRAGIIHWSSNEVVYISFSAFPPLDLALAEPTSARAQPTSARAQPTQAIAQEPDEGSPVLAQPTPARAQPTPARAQPTLPHTRGVSLLVSTNHPTQNAEQTNKPTPPGPQRHQPWEAPLSFRLLTDRRVAMSQRIAERLAAAHPYWEVRDAVAHWWEHRKSGGGRFEETPGIVITWLDNPDEFTIPTLSDVFRRSDLYRDYRTPDELAAEQAALDEALRQEEQDLADPPDEQPTDSLDVHDAPEPGSPEAHWQQVKAELQLEQGGTFDRWVNDTYVISHEEGSNTFLISLPDAFRYDWIVNRLSKQILRKLAVITGRPAEVKFEVIVPGAAGKGAVNSG